MKNLSYSTSSRREYQLLIETEITACHHRSKLPRHILSVESQSHRRQSNIEQINYVSRTCLVKPSQAEEVSFAYDILKYQLSDRQAQKKHLENLRCNLQHRLRVAKNQGNNQLVSILQEEFRQLETSVCSS
ncbi:hypothetical protein [Pleurocapsa sp. FMAR1]|uniref:hypothetical protein n=1 Tax=Pleurocapsa sp. FMAR1 TaxID=3040204 RepID=UPI0029C93D51|nr:hypothetical protein [Pleurocapsa sp. FMAR1]